MKRQKYYLRVGLLVLFFYILLPLACTPTKVQVFPRETPPEKITSEKTIPGNIAPGKISSVKTDRGKPSLERPPTEKIPTLKAAPEKSYDDTVSEWKSYQDLVRWMENDFSFDKERYEKFEGTLPVPRAPEETFKLKSGIYIDAAMFLKETLNRINPSYKAKIVILIIRPYGSNHYVCSFEKDGKLFILDYGTPYKEVTGIHGPYRSLGEYKKFYQNEHPMKGEIEAITYLP